ncbi:PspC domain-containing protein [Gordonia iterans]
MNTSTLSDLWSTRPVRRRKGHKVAGVCSGIGARYNVDPTLVRVAFVVATLFGGSGVLAYLVAVVAMPSDRTRSDGTPRPDHVAGMSFGKLVLLGIIAIVLVSTFGGGGVWSGGGVAGTVLLAVGWWLLYQRTPVPPPGTSADTLAEMHDDPAWTAPYPAGGPVVVPVDPGAQSGAGGPAGAADPGAGEHPQSEPSAPSTAPTASAASTPDTLVDRDQPVPPAWDPLGVAPFAWDLPEPTPAPQPPAVKVPSSPLTPVTLGVAVLTAAAGSVAHLLGAEWFTVGRIASLALAVIGLGLVIAAFQRRPEGSHSTGLIWLAALAAGIVVVSTLVQASDWRPTAGGIGERKYQVAQQSELQERYDLSIGNIHLDLRELGSLDADKTITLNQSIGEISVQLPEKVRVRAVCDVTVGNYDCPQGVVGGGEDGPVLTINARVGMGNVEMKR